MKPGQLYKTTIIIWTEHDPDFLEIEPLARDATSGDSYCSAKRSVLIEDPKADPDWDGTDFFDAGDDDACPDDPDGVHHIGDGCDREED